jgi:hypothetical protein
LLTDMHEKNAERWLADARNRNVTA